MPLVRASLSYGASFFVPVFCLSIERIMQPCRYLGEAPVASFSGLGKTGSNCAKLTLT